MQIDGYFLNLCQFSKTEFKNSLVFYDWLKKEFFVLIGQKNPGKFKKLFIDWSEESGKFEKLFMDWLSQTEY